MEDVEGEQDGSALAFPKALVLAAGFGALFCLLLFLPAVGPLLLLTVGPFFACFYAVRLSGLATPRGWLWLGLAAGALTSLVESAVLFSVAGIFGPLDLFEPAGLGLLVLLWLSNIAFGTLGARRAARPA